MIIPPSCTSMLIGLYNTNSIQVITFFTWSVFYNLISEKKINELKVSVHK